MTKKTFAPFELKMTEQQAIDGLKSTYGDEFTAADVRAFASMNDIAYATVTKKIKKYRVAAGKWNLKVTQKSVENIEKSFKSPAAMPAVEKNLVPTKDDTFVKFGPFTDVKKIIQSKQFYPAFITGLSGNGISILVTKLITSLNLIESANHPMACSASPLFSASFA